MFRTLLKKLGFRAFPSTPALVTDCVAFDPQRRVLLVRRRSEPFAGWYALPGGFVDIGETIKAACHREVQEETGLDVDEKRLRLVGGLEKQKSGLRSCQNLNRCRARECHI
jgi:8-oxo-dGTP diphosphatase